MLLNNMIIVYVCNPIMFRFPDKIPNIFFSRPGSILRFVVS